MKSTTRSLDLQDLNFEEFDNKKWPEISEALKFSEMFYKKQHCKFSFKGGPITDINLLHSSLIRTGAKLRSFLPEFYNAIETTYSININDQHDQYINETIELTMRKIAALVIKHQTDADCQVNSIEYNFKLLNNPIRYDEFYLLFNLFFNTNKQRSTDSVLSSAVPLRLDLVMPDLEEIMSW